MAKTLILLLTISFAITSYAAASQGPAVAPTPSIETPISPSSGAPFIEEPLSPGSAAAPIPALDCTNALLNMSSCLTYVEAGSNTTVPDKGCCPSVSDLVNNNPICLCQLLHNGDVLGIKIDITKSLMLPTACKIDAPSVSLCSAIGIPVASPSGPASSPGNGGPNEPGSSAISGTPATAPATNTGGKNTVATSLGALITIFIAITLF